MSLNTERVTLNATGEAVLLSPSNTDVEQWSVAVFNDSSVRVQVGQADEQHWPIDPGQSVSFDLVHGDRLYGQIVSGTGDVCIAETGV